MNLDGLFAAKIAEEFLKIVKSVAGSEELSVAKLLTTIRRQTIKDAITCLKRDNTNIVELDYHISLIDKIQKAIELNLN